MELWEYVWWLLVFIGLVATVLGVGDLLTKLGAWVHRKLMLRRARRYYTGYRGPEDDLPY